MHCEGGVDWLVFAKDGIMTVSGQDSCGGILNSKANVCYCCFLSRDLEACATRTHAKIYDSPRGDAVYGLSKKTLHKAEVGSISGMVLA